MSKFSDMLNSNREPKVFDYIEHEKKHAKTLNCSLCVPSLVDSYSMCIGYMKQWILSKFNPDTFKTVWIDGKHIYDDFRKFSRSELLKKPMPSLTILPSIDWAFNNENIDSYPYGLTTYTALGRFKHSFFSDSSTDTYLGIGFETILMPFNFRVRVESRAQEIDMYNHMKKACRVGFTDGKDVDLDFHVPYELMLQVARDNGFTIIETEGSIPRIREISKFLTYLNTHSSLPFIYKHRNINGNNEFYIRMNNLYVHVRPNDISPDDGERENHLSNNYFIDFSCEVRFPAPKFYAYYSSNEHKLHKLYSAQNAIGDINVATVYQFKAIDMPDQNARGWNLHLTTSWEDDECFRNNKTLVIDFNELFEGELGKAVIECLNAAMSPSIFIDFRLYNDAKIMDYKIDWENLILETKNIVHSPMTYIGLYIDLDFMHNILETSKESYKNRITEAVDPVER